MPARRLSQVQESVLRALGDARQPSGRRVLAVSGGVDSMVLLHAAVTVLPRDRLLVATFDHGTGLEATRAAASVVERAAVLGIECVSERARTAPVSEADLRAARWGFLRRVATQFDGVVCTAHTADDQIETVLMRTLRGAGARGLAALYADSGISRPLLSLRRADLVRYARRFRLQWVEDPSNASPKYLRNRLRRDLLPALRRVRPSIDSELLEVAAKAACWRSEVEAHVAWTVSARDVARGAGFDVDVTTLDGYPIESLAVLWPAIAARAGVTLDRRGTRRLAEFTVRARVGARIQLSGGWEVSRSRDALQLRASREAKPTPSPLALSHTTSWYDWSFRPAKRAVDDDAWFAWLPADRPLMIRAWTAGDAMGIRPSGRVRKVKQLLSAAGVTGHQRVTWPVVVAEQSGEILWVPGVRRSDAASGPAGRSGLSFVCEYVNR
jgi:tRNA(Ile)-lysidine synthase